MTCLARQWSTRSSGPLARPGSAEKALKRQKSKESIQKEKKVYYL